MAIKYVILERITKRNKFDVKLLFIFGNKGQEVLFITKNDDVFAFGKNIYGRLGFGHINSIDAPEIVIDLCRKNIIEFANGSGHVVAKSKDGQTFCWGYNASGQMGNGNQDSSFFKPMKILQGKFITDIACGEWHSLVLTSSGELYAWGYNEFGQIGNGKSNDCQLSPYKLNGFDGHKIKSISCGAYHSMALTVNGLVYSWGSNDWGQLGLPKVKESNNSVPQVINVKDHMNKPIKSSKIMCGYEHSMFLSNRGDIYAFGRNDCGQIGNGNKIMNQKVTKIETGYKFNDIALHASHNISISISNKNVIFVWGQCGGENITCPKETEYKQLNDVFASVFQITYKTIDFESMNVFQIFTGNGKYASEFFELCVIGSGQYGIVCKASDRISNDIFAIKKFPIVDKNDGEKILKTIEMFSEVENEFIVKFKSAWLEENYYKNLKLEQNQFYYSNISDICITKGNYLFHIQKELCPLNLKQLIEKLNEEFDQKQNRLMTILGFSIASFIFIELIECVNYLHENNYIHTNLKPQNILISDGSKGRYVKLADFGLTGILSYSYQYQINDSYTKNMWTSRYLAPELETKRNYDFKADIYSLGVILQEMFNIDINL